MAVAPLTVPQRLRCVDIDETRLRRLINQHVQHADQLILVLDLMGARKGANTKEQATLLAPDPAPRTTEQAPTQANGERTRNAQSRKLHDSKKRKVSRHSGCFFFGADL